MPLFHTYYVVEQRIRTRIGHSSEASDVPPGDNQESIFNFEGMELKLWDARPEGDRQTTDWLASAKIKARNARQAYSQFEHKLETLIPKISFICGAFMEYASQPFMICKEKDRSAYVSMHSGPMGNPNFNPDLKAALSALLQSMSKNNNFFIYWLDSVNAINPATQLLLLCTSLEVLSKDIAGDKKWRSCAKNILGKDLYETVYKQKAGIRHKLTHGEAIRNRENLIPHIRAINIKLYDAVKTLFADEDLSYDYLQYRRILFESIQEDSYFAVHLKQKYKSWPLTLNKLHESHKRNGHMYEFPKYTKLTDTLDAKASALYPLGTLPKRF